MGIWGKLYHLMILTSSRKKGNAMNETFLMVSATARALNRSTESVRQYERTGKLPAIRTVDGRRLFRKSDVEAFAKTLKGRGEKGRKWTQL